MVINGIDVSGFTKSCNISLQDLDSDSSTRNIKGQMMRDRIAVKRKIELEFGPLKSEEIKNILSAVSGVFLNVSFIDPLEGNATRQMYVGDRSAALFDNKRGLWLGLKFSLIER